MMQEIGYCTGIENYSRHLDGREARKPPVLPAGLLSIRFLLVVDESHITIPQINGCSAATSRGRAPWWSTASGSSALDNRPLKFDEFEILINQAIFISATRVRGSWSTAARWWSRLSAPPAWWIR